MTGFYKGRVWKFDASPITIGRASGNSLRFPLDLAMGREHARFVYKNEEWIVEDLGSVNGIRINGVRVPSRGTATVRTGDVVECGYQNLRFEWETAAPATRVAAPPRIGSGELPNSAPQPVLFGSPSQPATGYKLPPPPPQTQMPPVRPSATGPKHRWVLPKESVEIQGKVISAGYFFVGTHMPNVWKSGSDPSLVNPALSVAAEPLADDTLPIFGFSYDSLGPAGRFEYLDWMAAGRPPEKMTERIGLFFLSGIERRFLAEQKVQEGLPDVCRELLRLADGAPRHSHAAKSMREFVKAVGATRYATRLWSPANALLDITQQYFSSDIKMFLAQKAQNGEALQADEALLVTLADEQTYPRTAFFRCRREILQIFSHKYKKRYPEGIKLKTTRNPLTVVYQPVHQHLPTCDFPQNNLKMYSIVPATLSKLRELLEESTSALDAYSRRLATRPNEYGKLPAIALLPDEIASKHEELFKLKQLVEGPADSSTSFSTSTLASVWNEWPDDRSLNKLERELLSKAFWHAGYLVEPHWSLPLPPDSFRTLRLAPRNDKLRFDISSDYESAMALASLAATVMLADGRATDEEKTKAHLRLGDLTNLSDSELFRLKLHLDWLLDVGPPKITKKMFSSVEVEQRMPLLRFLADVAGADGEVAPSEVKELERIAKGLGLSPDEVYPLLHQTHAGSIKPAAHKQSGTALDMDKIALKLASSQAASRLLSTVFIEEELQPAAQPLSTSGPAEDAEGVDFLHSIIRELKGSAQWSAESFGLMSAKYGKMPAAAYDQLNEAALDATGNPLLEGEDPIYVDFETAEELLS